MHEKENVARELESENTSLDRKCERLREYIRKLTHKCEEWADYADAQSKLIDKAKRNRRQVESVDSHSSPFFTTPANGAPRVLDENHSPRARYDQSSQCWSAERRMLDRVANLAGEDDLDALASELRQFGLK